jgi:hypothetical protein
MDRYVLERYKVQRKDRFSKSIMGLVEPISVAIVTTEPVGQTKPEASPVTMRVVPRQ